MTGLRLPMPIDDMPPAVCEALTGPGATGPDADRPDSEDPAARDRYWMRVALCEALAAFAIDEVPVGAVVVGPDGQLLGSGYNLREHRMDPTAHAEIIAMAAAAPARGYWRLDGCTMVVTLEPCPMCAGALVNGRIGRVVFGASDPKAGACGSLMELHADSRLNHRYPVTPGVLAEACGAILTEFFRRKRDRAGS